MKTSFRQRVLIAVGISAGLLASLNLFAQNTQPSYTITSQSDYLHTVESIQDLAVKIYNAHVKYPALAYSHVYNQDGSLMGFTVTGVPQSSEADKISGDLMQLEILGNAVNKMDIAFLPESKNDKLTSRVSKKQARQNTSEQEHAMLASVHPDDFIASNK